MSSWTDPLRRWLGLPVPLPRVRREIGDAWLVHLPSRVYLADAPGRGRHSPVVVWEDGRPLPHPHASCDAVRRDGGGRFAHVGEWLLLSSTDGGSVEGGGHDYRISTAWWLYRRAYGDMPFRYDADAQAFAPVNVLPRDASTDVVRRDADYAVRIGSQYLRDLGELGVGPDRAAVLEIGPGHHLGTALVLAGAGYDVSIADPYPLQWDPGYHPPLYERVRDVASGEIDGWRGEPVQRVLDAGDHEPVIGCVPASAEDLGAVDDAVFDAVVSTAVLEHVRDPQRAVRELARVTRPGGVGLHQVDHRDHRDFSRPLEYLCLADDEFESLFDRLFGECGNRIRPHELATLFRDAGFEIEQQRVTQRAEAAYAARVARRLQGADGSRYRGADVSGIDELSCWFAVRRQSD